MFEQQVEPLRRRGGGGADLEQQVGDGAAQLLVDEGAWGAAQGGPEEAAPEGVGQAGAEEGGGLLGVGEHQTEQVIVGLTQRRCHHALTSTRRQRRFSVRGDGEPCAAEEHWSRLDHPGAVRRPAPDRAGGCPPASP